MVTKHLTRKPLVSEVQPLYYKNILETIGQTPLVKLNQVAFDAVAAHVLAKVEYFNPGGSSKDRIGLSIIENAEQEGRIKPGGTIVEATSGNTGAGLALVAAVKGYKTVFVMPDKMSEEKVRFLRAFGARVIITPTAVAPDDPRSYYSVAARIVNETPNSLLANQYHNPANPEAHYRSTGPELWRQTAGKIDVLIAGMGTGGTITGTARYLKEQNPNLKVVGVDIQGSLLYETWKLGHIPDDPHPKTYKIEGIGEDFLPSTLDMSLIDEVVQVDDRESFLMARRLVREEGIFAGGSSGSAVAGLLKSKIVRSLKPDQIAVVILPDTGNRYLSKLFDDNWMRENGYLPASRSEDTVAALIDFRNKGPVITATSGERITAVVEKMKAYEISQLPVVDDTGRLIGIVSEVDLLDHLLHAGHIHDPEETISGIINPSVVTVEPGSSIELLLSVFDRGKVAVIVADGRPVNVLTKIDLIDYLTEKTAR
ncbi:MAG: cystathionine beta-synthase [Chloroflexi bacterium GWB2_54_36]|nr:MAG: cystathionine beta-synthase [Chloroflexi bacterium GWB2_54_36]